MKRPLVIAAPLVAAAVAATGGHAGRAVQLRVGIVTDAGTVPSARTLVGQPLLGFVRAERQLPIHGTIRYLGPTQGSSTALNALGRQDYDLVVGYLFDTSAVHAAARRFPQVQFLIVDAPPRTGGARREPNVHRAVFRAEQSAYLAGYLSALMADRRHGRAISAVGGLDFYGVNRWIVGYRAGARKADPHIKVRVDYSNDFNNPAKCRRVALSQIAAGSRVIFDVAGACGVGALEAARDKHVWGVGVDTDHAYLGPYMLTSAVNRLDRGVFDTIERLVRGKLGRASTVIYSLRNGGVELGRVSPKVPKPFLRRLAAIRRQIVGGTIVVPRARP